MILPEKKKLTILLLAMFLLTGCGAKANVTEVTEETVVQTTAPVQTTMAVETTAATEPTLPPIVYEMGEAHGTEVFFCNDTAFPVGLGYPELSDGQIDALIEETDYAKIAETITTLPDAVNFCKRAGFTVGTSDIDPMISYGGLHHSKSAWKSLKEKVCNERSFDSVFHYLLLGDYEDIGYIWISNYQDNSVAVYIYEDGHYYFLLPTEYLTDPQDSGWLDHMPEEFIACAEDFRSIAESIKKHWYAEDWPKGKYSKPISQVYLVRSDGDFVVGQVYPDLAFPTGTEVTEYFGRGFVYADSILDWQSQTRMVNVPEIYHGTKVFSCAGTSLPVGLGMPKLSDEEIDALIAEGDYEKMAATITTMADAANLYYRMELDFDESRDNNTHGEFHYRNSAWSVLENGIGQCISMSNLNHYLLQGDYEEVGYVNVRTSGDGHVMSYIRHEGIYYLINATDYVYMYNPDHTARIYDNSWIQDWPSEMICAAEDFQTIADSLMKYMKLGNGQLPNLVHLVQSPGDYVVGSRGGMRLYPEECTVTEYYGYGVAYGQATALDWKSQTRLDS